MNTLTPVEKNREVAKGESNYVAPNVDVFETKDEYLLEADMPGVNKAGLEVLLEGNELTLTGRRQPASGEGTYLHRETVRHDFRRTFVLDPVIDAARISAQIDQGVLRVRLPKAEMVKPRRVAVTD
jgi:HSP20 family protein